MTDLRAIGHRTLHTPGPWELWTSNSFRRFCQRGGGGVCEPITQNDGHPDLYFRNGGADGPDARLIAAAPDLLTACEALIAYFDSGNDVPVDRATIHANSVEVFIVRAAIKKARGE